MDEKNTNTPNENKNNTLGSLSRDADKTPASSTSPSKKAGDDDMRIFGSEQKQTGTAPQNTQADAKISSGTAQKKTDNGTTDEILDIINQHHRQFPTPAPDPTTEVKSLPKRPTPMSYNTPVQKGTASVRPQNPTPVNNSHASKNTISLDDFSDTDDNQPRNLPKKRIPAGNSNAQKGKAEKKAKKKSGTLSGFTKTLIYLAVVLSLCIIISVTVINVGNDIFAFVKEDKEAVITLPKDATAEDVAEILKENGIIEYPIVYEMYTEFRIGRRAHLTGKYKTTPITVNANMNYDQLLAALSVTKSQNNVVRITIPEGYTTQEIIDLFKASGMRNAGKMEEALQNFDYDYRFMDSLDKELQSSEDAKYRLDSQYGYRLEGYLFPDTYDFFVDENPVTSISKLLDNFNSKFDESFYDRATQLGYTVDEIIILASIIEAEGDNVDDYAKISSVFHNRMNSPANFAGKLQSDATVQYALGTHKSRLEDGDTDIEHPYNTYQIKGLPPGPICNPGYEAIYAALYPEKTNYYYFLSRSDGVTVFSTTYNQHLNAIAESNALDAQLAEQQQ